METTNETAAPTRAQLITVIEEMNKILVDCKIPTAKSYTNEILVNMILAKELELTSTDFVLAIDDTRSPDSIFSTDAAAIMVQLGITIPAPPKPKAEKKAKGPNPDKFTRHDAVLQALDNMPADGQTFAELQKVIDDIMVARGNRSLVSTSCSEVLKFSLLSLIHFGKMVKDSESKKYTFINDKPAA